MGYGIYLTGTPLSGEQAGAGRDDRRLVSALRDAIESEITDPLQRRLTTLDISDNRLQLELHPSAEPIEISVEDGAIEVSAKTSGAGPGYHAMLAELMKNVALRAGIALPWDDLQVGWANDTGYHAHRDINLLREEAARLLRSISRHVQEVGGGVSLPNGKSADRRYPNLRCICVGSNGSVFAQLVSFTR